MKIAALACALLLAGASQAAAEHKLLATDLLDRGQFELTTGFEYSVMDPTLMGQGSYHKVDYSNTTSLGAGLGHGLELNLALRQVFKERDLEPSGPETRSGFGDLSARLAYRVPVAQDTPFALVTGLEVKFETAPKDAAGSGSTDFGPFLAGSYRLKGHWTPYGQYQAVLREGGGAPDGHLVTLGVEKELNHFATLDLKASGAFATATPERTGAEDFAFEAGAYLQLAKNLYLLPSFAVLQLSPRTVGEIRQQSVAGARTAAAIYYFFE